MYSGEVVTAGWWELSSLYWGLEAGSKKKNKSIKIHRGTVK